MKSKFVLFFLGISCSAIAAEDTTGLKYSIAADLVGQLGLKHIETAPPERDRMLVREAEISFYGPIDHLFEGVVTGAAHFESGVQNFELHEGFIQSTNLVPRLQLKGGLFFLGIGRLNRFHRHDWAFTFAPKVQEQFFGEEGVMDTGLEASYLAPLPFHLNVVAGTTSGFTYGHSHSAGSRPLTPTHYTRWSSYQDLSENTGMEIGLNYLGRKTMESNQTSLYGLDFVTKWAEGKFSPFMVQSEAWFSKTTSGTGSVERKLGTYIFPQYGFEQMLIGLRFDTFSHLNKTNSITGQREKNIEYTYVPTLTYKSSEFSSFRISYSDTTYRELSEQQAVDKLLSVQAIFILGAHPAHLF